MFNDTELYHQMLRDITTTGQKSEIANHQNVFSTIGYKPKVKVYVDSKASKGRKLRYEVHAKLQHFMIPVVAQSSTWHEEQIDDLFMSLSD